MAENHPKQDFENFNLEKSGNAKVAKKLASKANKKIQNLLIKGHSHQLKSEWEQAAKYYLEAWDYDLENLDILTLVAYVLSQLGVRDKAIAVLEKALSIHGPTNAICQIMGLLCMEMSIFDTAEKIWAQAIQMNPQNRSAYVNYASALYKQEKYEEAINFCQEVLPVFPDYSDLWNVLGTAVQYGRDATESIVFYEEATRLDPENYKAFSNLAIVEPSLEKRIDYNRKAIAIKPDCSEAHLGLAYLLLYQGKLEEAWQHYEWRLLSTRGAGQNLVYSVDMPKWEGESLADKTILVAAEQGVGDEIFFARAIEQLEAKAGRVILSCDERLQDIFQRSFPDVVCISYENFDSHGYLYRHFPQLKQDERLKGLPVDYYTPAASLPRFFWQDMSEIPAYGTGYLVPDPARVATWKDRVGRLGQGLKVGISWQSSNLMHDRKLLYTVLDDWQALFEALPDAHFINLQYGDVEEQLQLAEKKFGVTIHRWDDLDLKQDLEANLALMANLDAVVGPSTATQAMSIASGVKTCMPIRGRPWWCFGMPVMAQKLPFMPNLKFFDIFWGETWSDSIVRVAEELQLLLNEKTKI